MFSSRLDFASLAPPRGLPAPGQAWLYFHRALLYWSMSPTPSSPRSCAWEVSPRKSREEWEGQRARQHRAREGVLHEPNKTELKLILLRGGRTMHTGEHTWKRHVQNRNRCHRYHRASSPPRLPRGASGNGVDEEEDEGFQMASGSDKGFAGGYVLSDSKAPE